jgi:type VI secretion system secreted protein Hcp
MAFDAYLKIDGVKGESKSKGFEDQIELLSFSWGASNPTTVGSGSGSGAGKVSISSFNLMKKTDAASGPIFQACCAGKHFPEATVTLRKSGGDAPIDYLVYKFSEVYVDKVQWSGSSGGDDLPMENVSFTFGKVQFTYTPQSATGGEEGPVVGGWDIRAGVKA